MKKVLLVIILLSQLLLSCNQNEKEEEGNISTRITKAENRDDLKLEEEMKSDGEQFLKEKELVDGVTKTNSGLLYEIIKEGNGESPSASNIVKVNYSGKFIDGKVFDSTEGKDPIEFGLNQVISGWTEGLQLMNRGAKYKFYIPYQLAYGAKGYSGLIPPFSVLIFEVELLDFK